MPIVPANRLRRSLTATIAVPAILMGTAAGGLLWQTHSQMIDTDWVEHTDHVMLLVANAETEFLQAENALRTYLVSLDSADRGSLQNHWNNGQQIIREIAAQVSDNPPQEQRLVALNGLENEWLEATKGAGSVHTDAEKLELSRHATEVGDEVLKQLGAMSAVEEQLRVARDARRDSQYRFLIYGIPLAALILVVGLTTAAWREIRSASSTFAEALKEAEAANRSKTNFLAVVSHELRNPLNSILLWCNALLSGGSLEGRTQQGLGAIFRAAKAQAQLIEDLLDISRIESGQMRFDVQPVNLADVLRAAIESMSPAAEAKSIAVQMVIDPRASTVTGDAHRLQQAVWNLLSNAIKFTPQGGKVQVRLERINSHLEIVVADNGKGIDAHALENVFDRFWQGVNRAGGDSGMGLGLSIVKHIVDLHGGSVTAHSDGPGKGSVFTIRLPLPVTTAGLVGPARRHPTVAANSPSAQVARLESISALVVDDDPETREALRSLLTSLGARVKTAGTVENAIASLDESDPDVLISDLGMPVRDGYSLIKEIRERERAAASPEHLPAIALTAYGRVDDRVEVFASGFDSHVVKPVDPAELAAIIKRLVEARRSGNDQALSGS
jgi:signal transduction histidine kinase/CheY-like chemotaxis protein